MIPMDTSRPTTPDSPMTSSLYHASSTIDDLTTALANFSRVPSPEPSSFTCCCGSESCENLKTWLESKSRLESRLVLSAEVGQALLQRHAAYVRQSERQRRNDDGDEDATYKLQLSNEDLHRELEELVREKVQLEKRLNQALVNNEVTEVSNKTILHELQEARETISRLSAHHARSVGWETRLSSAIKERDDMQQERDSETHRARLAESRFAALKEKAAKVQNEVRRLQSSLEEKRQSRLEISGSILQDARLRLDSVRNSLGTSAVAEEELTKVLESLVQDNETLKADNAELQHLLAESRDDLHTLQEEVEEQRANAPAFPSGRITPNSRHFHTGSVPSINMKEYSMFGAKHRRTPSAESKVRRRVPQSIDIRPLTPSQGPLTPDTTRSPLSPDISEDAKWAPFAPRSSRRSSNISFMSRRSYHVEDDAEDDGEPGDFEKKGAHRPLLLLSRSRGVQTDPEPSPLSSLAPSISPQDPRSESSSFSENSASHIALILERISQLLNRLTQADAYTLSNRLKRQNLKGADVGHLSQTTVNGIVADAAALRGHFRALLEDDKLVALCTRKDLRNLFKFVKDAFAEMGQMRVALNTVVLDPAAAVRISELALNPGKAERGDVEANAGGVAAWMAPISKLFSPTGRVEQGPLDARGALARSTSLNVAREARPPPRFVPKLGPALAASATTVNVEFSGTGIGRSVTSTVSAQPVSIPITSPSHESTLSQHPSVSSSLMGIFAGAPKADADPWVVLPSSESQHTLRKATSFMKASDSSATIGRSAGRRNGAHRLSRNVDAVIDVERPQVIDEEPAYLPPLLERTLRRRGLSDSSIHSTFTSHGEQAAPASPTQAEPSPQRPAAMNNNNTASTSSVPASRLPAWPDRSSVFQALSRTVQNFRSASLLTPVTPTSAAKRDRERSKSKSRERSESPTRAPRGTNSNLRPDTTSDAFGTVRPGLPAIGESVSQEFSDPSTPPPPRKAQTIARGARTQRSGGVLPSMMSAWATSPDNMLTAAGDDPFIASSLRDESYMQRMSAARSRMGNDEAHGRDFY